MKIDKNLIETLFQVVLVVVLLSSNRWVTAIFRKNRSFRGFGVVLGGVYRLVPILGVAFLFVTDYGSLNLVSYSLLTCHLLLFVEEIVFYINYLRNQKATSRT